jgi:CRISPR-associated endonuclease Cas2
MNTVVVYDITDDKRRNRLRKFLKELGIRSQKSVFWNVASIHERLLKYATTVPKILTLSKTAFVSTGCVGCVWAKRWCWEKESHFRNLTG